MPEQHRPHTKMQSKNSNTNTTTARARGKSLSALIVCFGVAVFANSEAAFAAVENTATATATFEGNPVVSNPDTASVPVDAGTPALVVDKTANDTTDVVAGQVVTYTYVVRNAGAQTLTNVSLNDSHNGAGPAPVPGNETLTNDAGLANDSTDAAANDGVWTILAPGDAITMTATYTVMQADLDTLQ